MTDQPIDDGLDIPDDTPQVKMHTVRDAFGHDVAFNMGFVGLGQGGGRIAETFFKEGYRRCLAINTAQADLATLDAEIPQLDLKTGGAGQDMEKGKEFLKRAEESVWDSLLRAVGDDPDYLMVCASLGGGTGSGGARTLIEILRKYMADKGRDPQRVGAVVSLPNVYEGQRKCRNAVRAFKDVIATSPSPLIIIDNKRIEELFRVGAADLFQKCNTQVAKLFHLFNRLAIQRSDLHTFDRADFARLLDGGTVVFGAAPVKQFETKADLTEGVRNQLQRTVLAEVDLKQARQAGCIFMGGESVMQQVPMEYFGEAFSLLTRMMADDSVVYQGVYKGSTEDLRCYTMLSGLGVPEARLAELEAKAGLRRSGGSTAEYLGVD